MRPTTGGSASKSFLAPHCGSERGFGHHRDAENLIEPSRRIVLENPGQAQRYDETARHVGAWRAGVDQRIRETTERGASRRPRINSARPRVFLEKSPTLCAPGQVKVVTCHWASGASLSRFRAGWEGATTRLLWKGPQRGGRCGLGTFSVGDPTGAGDRPTARATPRSDAGSFTTGNAW